MTQSKCIYNTQVHYMHSTRIQFEMSFYSLYCLLTFIYGEDTFDFQSNYDFRSLKLSFFVSSLIFGADLI